MYGIVSYRTIHTIHIYGMYRTFLEEKMAAQSIGRAHVKIAESPAGRSTEEVRNPWFAARHAASSLSSQQQHLPSSSLLFSTIFIPKQHTPPTH